MHVIQGIEHLEAQDLGTKPRPWHPIEIFAMSYDIVREVS
jgi:hypothetical protein